MASPTTNAIVSSSRPAPPPEKSHRKHAKSKHKHHELPLSTPAPNGKEKKKKDKRSSRMSKSAFEHRFSRMRLSVPPRYGADWLAGAREILDGMLMRYVPQMQGVLLAHWEQEIDDDTVKIINDCPFGVCEVRFQSIVWAPKLGQKLYGSHSLSSPSHLSLLFSRTFNVSIPLQHIPLDEYEFETTGEDEQLDSEEEMEQDFGLNGRVVQVQEVGRWRSRKNGKLLGDGGKGIKFTVIGMQVTNQMLSLTGSLLSDPANPPPPPEPIAPLRIASRSPSLDIDFTVDPVPPAKQARTSNPKAAANGHTTAYDEELQPRPAIAQTQETIDDRFLSQREQKQRRKDDKKAKREVRKAQKEDKVLETVEVVGAKTMVGIYGDEDGRKRKAFGEAGGKVKKRK